MERSTRLALATGLALVVGALLFILAGDGILYFSSFFAGAPGSNVGTSLVMTGYAILALLIALFVSVVGYLLYRSRTDNSSSWRSY